MKPLILALLLLFSAVQCEAQIKTEYDRFENTTRVSTRRRFVARWLQFRAYFVYEGRHLAANSPTMIALSFESTSRSWRFLDNDTLVIIADGERLVFDGPLSKDRRLGRNVGVEESLLFECSIERARKILASKSVDVRVGIIEFTFGEDLGKDLRQLLEALNHP